MKLTKTQTVDIMNAIRAEQSEQYQSEIGEASPSNFMDIGRTLADYTPHANAFIGTLLDRIGLVLIKSANATNHLARFKKGQMPYGYTIEEIFVELAKRNVYDPTKSETELYKRVMPDVKAVFHSVNRQDFYKTTISQTQLKQAFTSENGLTSLISGIVASITKADKHDEFQNMKRILIDYGLMDNFKKVEVQDPLASQANMTAFVKKAREISSDMTFLSNKYNHAGVYNDTEKGKQVIFVTPALEASMDVDVLASAFNMDRAEYLASRVLIDAFDYKLTASDTGTTAGAPAGQLTDVYAILCDEEFFMVYDTHFASETVWNPQGLYWNYFLHHWQVMSASTFANAVVFTKTVA